MFRAAVPHVAPFAKIIGEHLPKTGASHLHHLPVPVKRRATHENLSPSKEEYQEMTSFRNEQFRLSVLQRVAGGIFNPSVNISMERGDFETYYPISSLAEAPLEFSVVPSSEDCLDVLLYLQVKSVEANGEEVNPKDKVAPTNLLLHSLFSQDDVKLNNQLVFPSLNTYPYKA